MTGQNTGSRLQDALGTILDGDVAELAHCVAEGRVYELRPGPRAKPVWILDSGPTDAPAQFKLWRVGDDQLQMGSRGALFGAIDDRVRALLVPYDHRATVPMWVHELRLAHVALLASAPVCAPTQIPGAAG